MLTLYYPQCNSNCPEFGWVIQPLSGPNCVIMSPAALGPEILFFFFFFECHTPAKWLASLSLFRACRYLVILLHLCHSSSRTTHNYGILNVSRCNYFSYDCLMFSHAVHTSTVAIFWWCFSMMFLLGSCKASKRELKAEGYEITAARETQTHLVSMSFSCPRRTLLQSRKRFSDMKWGAKQVGRICSYGAERGSSSRQSTEDITILFIHMPCVNMAFLNIWQSVAQTLCLHN